MKKGLIALSIGGLGIGTTEFVPMGLLEKIARDLDVSIPKAGHLISAYACGVVVGAPLLILFTSRIPPKRLLLLLMVMFTLFNSCSMLATNYDFLFMSRFFSGLAHGAFFGVGAVVASQLADEGKEARAVAIMFAGLTIANIGMVPLATYVGQQYHWHYSFAIVTFIGLLTLLTLWLWMPEMKAQGNTSLTDRLSFLQTKASWLLIMTIITGFGGFFCWISYISPLLTKITLFEESDVSYILALAGVGMLVGNWLGGRLADKYSPAPAVIFLLIGMCLALFLVTLLAGFKTGTLVTSFLTGAAAFSLAAPVQLLVIRTAKGSEMLAAAVSQAAFNLANASGAYLGGLPIEFNMGYRSPEYVGMLMALTGCFFATWFYLRMKRATV